MPITTLNITYHFESTPKNKKGEGSGRGGGASGKGEPSGNNQIRQYSTPFFYLRDCQQRQIKTTYPSWMSRSIPLLEFKSVSHRNCLAKHWHVCVQLLIIAGLFDDFFIPLFLSSTLAA